MCSEIYEAVLKGKVKEIKELVETALANGTAPATILNDGMLAAMDVIGQRFASGDVFVPEVLFSARTMNAGMEILKPHLKEEGIGTIGKAAIGTVKGDQHDIGKNLVRIMFEGKGIDVIDLGANVPAEKFVEAVENQGVTLVACSALLTTTMGEMKKVVDLLKEKGLRDKTTVMIGGAPITEVFCKEIGADFYTPDATSAAEVAKKALLGMGE